LIPVDNSQEVVWKMPERALSLKKSCRCTFDELHLYHTTLVSRRECMYRECQSHPLGKERDSKEWNRFMFANLDTSRNEGRDKGSFGSREQLKKCVNNLAYQWVSANTVRGDALQECSKRHGGQVCWKKHPELAPNIWITRWNSNWFQMLQVAIYRASALDTYSKE